MSRLTDCEITRKMPRLCGVNTHTHTTGMKSLDRNDFLLFAQTGIVRGVSFTFIVTSEIIQ